MIDFPIWTHLEVLLEELSFPKGINNKLTVNWQVPPQVLNFLILQLIAHVFQDGFHFRDMKLPTLGKKEVINDRNCYLRKVLIIFIHQLQPDETNPLYNYLKKNYLRLHVECVQHWDSYWDSHLPGKAWIWPSNSFFSTFPLSIK